MSQHYNTSEFHLEMLADEIQEEITGNTDWSFVVRDLGHDRALEYLSFLDVIQKSLRDLSMLITLHSKAMECDISHEAFYDKAKEFLRLDKSLS